MSWYNSFVSRMTQAGKSVGINFVFSGEVGNSLDSLRLLEWCRERYGTHADDRQNSVIQRADHGTHDEDDGDAPPAHVTKDNGQANDHGNDRRDDAQDQGPQERLADALAFMHFERGVTIGRHENLLATVGRCPVRRISGTDLNINTYMDAKEAKSVLDSDRFRSEVLSSLRETAASGVQSIPLVSFRLVLPPPSACKELLVHGSASVVDFSKVLRTLDKQASVVLGVSEKKQESVRKKKKNV